MKYSRIQCCFASFVCVVAFSFAIGASASDIEGVVNKACTKCHSAKRICLNLGVKSGPAWKTTVEKMMEKGARISAEKVDETALYLAKLDPDSAPMCE
jgi:predicted lactoylglutathione lyase